MVETLSQLFLNTVKTYIKDSLLTAKVEGRYVPLSTGEVARRVKHLSLGLAEVNRTTPHLASYERIKKVVLLDRDFDVDSELTPSLKVKRHIVEKTFKILIDFLYKE
ncbi:MAG: hypothetical protein A2Y70_07870 [Candidatus Aminicenantes bacterium RBG_13_64_14]|nr:MAG: hypothetical protein A2Y70_07870 [Candidatus Aminicenantes bacterium RBG_13_64_14]